MEILDNTNIVQCSYCDRLLRYTEEDISVDEFYPHPFIICPCGQGVKVKYDIAKEVNFPDTFTNYENAKKIDDKTINEWIARGLQYLEKNKDNDYFYVSSGDSIAMCLREADQIDIYVAKDYWHMSIE